MALTLKLDDVKPLLGAVGLGEDPTPAPKPVNNIPPPPMQMPPTPAAAGFTEWASDPQNAKKVTDGITLPGTPLMPPPPQMASANPPSIAPPNIAPPSMPGAAPSMGASTPNFSTQTKMDADMANNPSAYQHPTFAKGRGVVGNGLTLLAAGLAGGAGGLGNKDPLAGVNWVEQQKTNDAGIPAANAATYDLRNVKPLRDAANLEDIRSQINQRNAAADKSTAQAGAIPDALKQKQQATLAQLAKSGQKGTYDAQGNLSIEDDPNSEAFKSRKVLDDVRQSKQELQDAQAELARAKNDPNSPAFKAAQQRAHTAEVNSNAATLRARAYMGNYLQGAYNKGLDNQDLPGAPRIANDEGQQTTVGSKNANLAAKSQSNAAQFNDVHGALDSLENAATALVQKGGKINSPGVAAALSQPPGTLGQWLQGEGVKANLTPEERNYVTALAAAHENVQALRKSAGGTATDSAVAKLDALIPNASTPDIDYLKRQTAQIRSTAERLGKGATTAAGGLTVRGQQKGGITPPPTGGGQTYKQTATGPGGHKIGSNDGNTWFDVKTGKAIQ